LAAALRAYNNDKFNETLKDFFVPPSPFCISSLTSHILSLQIISHCSSILLSFGSSHAILDEHEIAMGQYVSTTRLDTYLAVTVVPSPSVSPPIFPFASFSRTEPTSIIAAANTAFTIIIRGAHDRLNEIAITNAYTKAGKEW
jgi:hypothetical protein